jgi:hypothetical protein
MTPGFRGVMKWVRTLHIYLSLLAFVLLFFFTLTGWLMVHEEAFGLNRESVREEEISFSPQTEDREDWVELLRQAGVKGRLTEAEGTEMTFAGPGTSTFVEIDRENGTAMRITEIRGISGHLFDLHRNRYTGWKGRVLQDITALLFMLVSLSGLFLWLPMGRRRRMGVAMIVLSGVVLLFWAFG